MTRLGPTEWVRAAWARFAGEGIEGVRVETLARDLGATKGSFYWHFSDREALLHAMLEDWEATGTAGIIAGVESGVGLDPHGRFRLLVAEVFNHPEWDAIEVGVRSWARHHDEARDVLTRVDARRVAYVCDLLVAAGVERGPAELRASVMYRVLVGDFTIRAGGGERLTGEAVEEIVALALRAGGTADADASPS